MGILWEIKRDWNKIRGKRVKKYKNMKVAATNECTLR
jgi:hypothetical protein